MKSQSRDDWNVKDFRLDNQAQVGFGKFRVLLLDKGKKPGSQVRGSKGYNNKDIKEKSSNTFVMDLKVFQCSVVFRRSKKS